jgi:V/A-type H+-transporting ATPase subunit I
MGDKTARQIGFILVVAGIFSVFFGFFVFAEFLAVPLQPTHEAKIEVGSWTEYLGIQFPFVPLIHKIEEVTDLLVISIAAAGIHLGVGYLFGIRNALKHDKKHAFAKLGWLIVLVALFSEIMLAVKGTRAGGFIVQSFLPFASWRAFTLGQIPFSPVSLVMLLSGIVMILPAEGVMALPEVIGLFANILSYARLAGIAVAETAIALGFIKILFLIFSLGNVIFEILGCLLVLTIYALVFVLGMIAASIQDVRLNYVEFFRKFFEGNGVPFRPFGTPAEGR